MDSVTNSEEVPILIFDLETTGKNPSKDEIVQFAGILWYPDSGKSGKYEFKCKPKISISQGATLIHGITNQEVSEYETFEHWAPTLVSILPKKFNVSGYNILEFDLPILDRQLAACGFKGIFDKSLIIDSFVLYKKQFPRTLKNVYKQYTGRNLIGAHDAMADTLAAFAVLSTQLKLENGISIQDVANKTSIPPDRRIGFSNHLVKNDKGQTVFGFGKHKGQLIRNHGNYIRWMLTQDFPAKVKEYLLDFLNNF